MIFKEVLFLVTTGSSMHPFCSVHYDNVDKSDTDIHYTLESLNIMADLELHDVAADGDMLLRDVEHGARF